MLRSGIVSTSPNPQAGGPLFSAAGDCLLNIFAALIPSSNRGQLHDVTTELL